MRSNNKALAAATAVSAATAVLSLLGEMPDVETVGRWLTVRGITGTPGDAAECPIALLLGQETGRDWTVGRGSAWLHARADSVLLPGRSVPLPAMVQRFTYAIDHRDMAWPPPGN